jgi:branched-chain amino acid aminotransferase
MLDAQGHVAEFATSNIFLVTREGTVVTPVANGTFLAGVTRSRVINLLAEEGIGVEQRSVKPAELDEAVEIFNTGNYGKVLPCTTYESRTLPIGKVATLARDKYWAFAGLQ